MKKKIVSKRRMGIGLLLGFSTIIWALYVSMNSEADGATNNLIASHDSSSPQYDRNCTNCHSNVLTEKSLDPSIKNAHVAMLPFAPGKTNNNKCVWCHRSVDLAQGTTPAGKAVGNLRKRVNTTLCTLCHGPSGPGKEFYFVGLSPARPDGPALYDLVCAACHGNLANSQVKGESASEIQKKINENEGGMGPLNVLSAEEIQAIANALAK